VQAALANQTLQLRQFFRQVAAGIVEHDAIQRDVEKQGRQARGELFRGLGDDGRLSAPVNRQHALEPEMALEDFFRQAPGNRQQVPVACFAGLAPRTRAEDDDSHEIVAQAVLQSRDNLSQRCETTIT